MSLGNLDVGDAFAFIGITLLCGLLIMLFGFLFANWFGKEKAREDAKQQVLSENAEGKKMKLKELPKPIQNKMDKLAELWNKMAILSEEIEVDLETISEREDIILDPKLEEALMDDLDEWGNTKLGNELDLFNNLYYYHAKLKLDRWTKGKGEK